MATRESNPSSPGGPRAPRAEAAGPRYPIESVDNALTLLRLVSDSSSVTVASAAEYLDVARSTAHRLLAMLKDHDLVQQDATLKSYLPGPALVKLGLAALREVDISTQVQPYLDSLVSEVGETTHFVVRRGTSIVYLHCVECDKALRAGSRTGDLLPCHCTAGGRALLAELDDDSIRRLYPQPRLPRLTPRSLHSRSQLLREIAETRRRGYAINLEESEAQLNAVSAVVRDRRGRALGAFTVAGPSFRLTEESIPRVAAAIRRCAAAATDSLVQPTRAAPSGTT